MRNGNGPSACGAPKASDVDAIAVPTTKAHRDGRSRRRASGRLHTSRTCVTAVRHIEATSVDEAARRVASSSSSAATSLPWTYPMMHASPQRLPQIAMALVEWLAQEASDCPNEIEKEVQAGYDAPTRFSRRSLPTVRSTSVSASSGRARLYLASTYGARVRERRDVGSARSAANCASVVAGEPCRSRVNSAASSDSGGGGGAVVPAGGAKRFAASFRAASAAACSFESGDSDGNTTSTDSPMSLVSSSSSPSSSSSSSPSPSSSRCSATCSCLGLPFALW
mmetsp:Transcript_2069/g.6568  ORF Transcript_2069/g.6568 Transcript_2069/m.6568 type:complete len:281 (+) Transcript_2069:1134-1976(+)